MATGKHVILLLHGIRTQGEWAQRAAKILESDQIIQVRPTRYEFFDVVRFLIPIKMIRDQPIERITRLIRDELSRNPASISIVAHSFGSYIISKVIERENDLKFRRILLCGSIVPDSFDWGRYGHRLGADDECEWQVVNDCGMRDIWPVLAKSITWGYGSSGRFGFGHPRVKDRFFDVGHSGFFSDNFVRKYWVPYFSKGVIKNGVLDIPTNPWWISVLTVAKLRDFVVIFVIALCLYAANPMIAGFLQKLEAVTPDPKLECREWLTWSAEREASMLSRSNSTDVDPAPIAVCQKLLDRNFNDPESVGLRARALAMAGRTEEAISLFLSAARLGDEHSNLVLGYYYLLPREFNPSQGLIHLKEAGKNGSGDALFAIGNFYELGINSSPNYEMAAEFFELATRDSFPEAYFRLGQLYHWGLGVQRDSAKAKILYREAIALGVNDAVDSLNEMKDED